MELFVRLEQGFLVLHVSGSLINLWKLNHVQVTNETASAATFLKYKMLREV